MKKQIAIAALTLTALTTTATAQAGQYTQAKQGATFFSSAIAGAVAGGPIGFIAGALGGVYWGEQIEKAEEAQAMSEQLAVTERQMGELKQQLLLSQNQARDLEALALESLTLPVLFQTGSDSLSERGREHVYSLAEFLKKHPRFSVRLDGHADPRGTDEYNNVLSAARAVTVKNTLEIAGIKPERIDVRGLGASQSTAFAGDAEGYSKDRRVEIDLIEPPSVVMN